MKRAAEAEIGKLTPVRTRVQIEAEMKEKQVSKNQANDELAYVLVTYLQNVEKLAKDREAAKAEVTGEAKAATAKLKTELPAATAKAETVVVDPKAATPAAETVVKDPKAAKEGERKDTPSPEELKSAKFIKEHRAEIDALVAKLPEGNAKSTIPGLLEKPTKDNVVVIQTEIGLKVGVKNGADGQFGGITLDAIKKYANAGGKKPTETATEKTPSTAPKPKKSKEKEAEEKRLKEKAAAEEAEKEARAKAENEARERTAKEKELDVLQKKTLANLKPIENGAYVVDSKFLKDGFAGAVFFKFDAKNGEWLWNSFNNPDHSKSSKWHNVSELESATQNGVTKMDSFGLNASTQETVNAILSAQKRSKELGIPLKDPSAPSPIVEKIPR